MSDINKETPVAKDAENDILVKDQGKRSIFGRTKKAKIINITALVLLGITIIWCLSPYIANMIK